MKVYGFDDADVLRGELQAEEVDRSDTEYGMEYVAGMFGWELASTSIARAKKELLARMKAEGADPETMNLVRSFKAHFFD